jgi:hypothetical protein
MKDYNNFKYIYPPRAETISPPAGLQTFERMGFIAQPKLNGSCGVLFLGKGVTKLMGRHNNSFTRNTIPAEHLSRLQKGLGFTVLVGEYMNKSKKDSKNKLFNDCFVIFDIIVYNSKHLINSTFQERQSILDELYHTTPFDDYISYISPSVYRVHNFSSGFSNKFNSIIKTDMYEGFVLKRPDGKLENGLREKNNTGWQLKIRKSTKNYQY